MTIVVGYTPTPPGRAALVAAAGVAAERKQPVVVVNSSRGDALADPGFATQADLDWARATLEEAGVEFSIRQTVIGWFGGRAQHGAIPAGAVPAAAREQVTA